MLNGKIVNNRIIDSSKKTAEVYEIFCCFLSDIILRYMFQTIFQTYFGFIACLAQNMLLNVAQISISNWMKYQLDEVPDPNG